MSQICPKCGFDHENPGSQLVAVQILACVLRPPEFEVYTSYGKVRPPEIIHIDQKAKKLPEEKPE